MMPQYLKRYTECTHKTQRGLLRLHPTKWSNKRIRHIFQGMIRRCYDKNEKAYKSYGKKGIKICKEWLENPISFENWSLENGYNDSLTIDRIDSKKGYSPENCRWITALENSKYKSTTNIITVDDVSHTGRDWSKILELGACRITTMLNTYPKEQVIEFIRLRLRNKNVYRKPNQSWMSAYGLE